ncbi:mechanosensitive ion channel family protein [Methyloligella sp. 2.7D]|uniref:mechanosensitive ion channel family protein n=1 Tax=unclassified Methyloligella TaxID=2625955 RepID=UPI00157BD61B|nr:mechanosensitive ion channel family protein [Methyloligella sp. GL2]QKP78536.1 mechanosensitive ion channel family protein [Methyloligella sp. GL2]
MRLVRDLLTVFCLLCALISALAAGLGPASAQTLGFPFTDPAAAQEKKAEAAPEEKAPEAEKNDASAAPLSIPKEVVDPDIPANELKMRLAPLTKDQLTKVAGEWLLIVQRWTNMVVEKQLEVLRAEGPLEDASRDTLIEFINKRNALFNKFNIVVDALEQKGGNKDLIQEYRSFRDAILVEEARSSDFETIVTRLRSWLVAWDGGVKVGSNLLIIVIAGLTLLVVARLVRRAVKGWIRHARQLSKLLQSFIVKFVYWLVLAFGLLVVIAALGIDITPIFALIGGASFIMAFAFQDTLSNLASGLMIMINRPFDEGDYVDVGGVAGTVTAVSIVATTVVTPDNQIIVIPNKQVWGQVITNVTGSTTRRVDLVFGIGYGDSIEKAQKVLEETIAAHPLVLIDPVPIIRVSELGDSAVNFIARPWVRSENYWTVLWDLTRQVKEAFDRNGISIPFPQRDLHVYGRSLPAAPESSAPSPRVKTDAATAVAQGDEGYDGDDGDK